MVLHQMLSSSHGQGDRPRFCVQHRLAQGLAPLVVLTGWRKEKNRGAEGLWREEGLPTSTPAWGALLSAPVYCRQHGHFKQSLFSLS